MVEADGRGGRENDTFLVGGMNDVDKRVGEGTVLANGRGASCVGRVLLSGGMIFTPFILSSLCNEDNAFFFNFELILVVDHLEVDRHFCCQRSYFCFVAAFIVPWVRLQLAKQ